MKTTLAIKADDNESNIQDKAETDDTDDDVDEEEEEEEEGGGGG